MLSVFAGLRPLIEQRARAETASALARPRRRGLGDGPGHDHRRQVDHLPADGRAGRRPRRPGRRAPAHAQARPPRSASRGWQPTGRTAEPLASYGSDAEELARVIAAGREATSRSIRGSRSGPARSSGRSATRRRGRSRTSSRGGPAHCCSTPAQVGRRAPRGRPDGPRTGPRLSLAGRASPAFLALRVRVISWMRPCPMRLHLGNDLPGAALSH